MRVSPPNLKVWLFLTQVRLATKVVFSSSVSTVPPKPVGPMACRPPVLLGPTRRADHREGQRLKWPR